MEIHGNIWKWGEMEGKYMEMKENGREGRFLRIYFYEQHKLPAGFGYF